MKNRSLQRSFLILYVTTGGVLLLSSLETVLSALRAPAPDPHVVLIAGSEVLAAILFMIPRTLRIGAAGLLAIFAAAFLLHALRGEYPLQLAAFAAAVLFVRTHGVGRSSEARAAV